MAVDDHSVSEAVRTLALASYRCLSRKVGRRKLLQFNDPLEWFHGLLQGGFRLINGLRRKLSCLPAESLRF